MWCVSEQDYDRVGSIYTPNYIDIFLHMIRWRESVFFQGNHALQKVLQSNIAKRVFFLRHDRFTDEAARERKKLDTEVEETEEMKTKRLEKAVREETIKEQVQVRCFLSRRRRRRRSAKHARRALSPCAIAVRYGPIHFAW